MILTVNVSLWDHGRKAGSPLVGAWHHGVKLHKFKKHVVVHALSMLGLFTEVFASLYAPFGRQLPRTLLRNIAEMLVRHTEHS